MEGESIAKDEGKGASDNAKRLRTTSPLSLKDVTSQIPMDIALAHNVGILTPQDQCAGDVSTNMPSDTTQASNVLLKPTLCGEKTGKAEGFSQALDLYKNGLKQKDQVAALLFSAGRQINDVVDLQIFKHRTTRWSDGQTVNSAVDRILRLVEQSVFEIGDATRLSACDHCEGAKDHDISRSNVVLSGHQCNELKPVRVSTGQYKSQQSETSGAGVSIQRHPSRFTPPRLGYPVNLNQLPQDQMNFTMQLSFLARSVAQHTFSQDQRKKIVADSLITAIRAAATHVATIDQLDQAFRDGNKDPNSAPTCSSSAN